MFLLRILIIAFVIGYLIWFVNNRVLGKNLKLAQVLAITLVSVSFLYFFLAILSYLVERFF